MVATGGDGPCPTFSGLSSSTRMVEGSAGPRQVLSPDSTSRATLPSSRLTIRWLTDCCLDLHPTSAPTIGISSLSIIEI